MADRVPSTDGESALQFTGDSRTKALHLRRQVLDGLRDPATGKPGLPTQVVRFLAAHEAKGHNAEQLRYVLALVHIAGNPPLSDGDGDDMTERIDVLLREGERWAEQVLGFASPLPLSLRDLQTAARHVLRAITEHRQFRDAMVQAVREKVAEMGDDAARRFHIPIPDPHNPDAPPRVPPGRPSKHEVSAFVGVIAEEFQRCYGRPCWETVLMLVSAMLPDEFQKFAKPTTADGLRLRVRRVASRDEVVALHRLLFG